MTFYELLLFVHILAAAIWFAHRAERAQAVPAPVASSSASA